MAMDRLSDHRFLANYFRCTCTPARLNLLVRLRRVVAAPPAVTVVNRVVANSAPAMAPTIHVGADRAPEPFAVGAQPAATKKRTTSDVAKRTRWRGQPCTCVRW